MEGLRAWLCARWGKSLAAAGWAPPTPPPPLRPPPPFTPLPPLQLLNPKAECTLRGLADPATAILSTARLQTNSNQLHSQKRPSAASRDRSRAVNARVRQYNLICHCTALCLDVKCNVMCNKRMQRPKPRSLQTTG